MMEINVENFPRLAKKSEAESHEHIPSGHLSGAEWKWLRARVLVKIPGPISAFTWAVDLPDGFDFHCDQSH